MAETLVFSYRRIKLTAFDLEKSRCNAEKALSHFASATEFAYPTLRRDRKYQGSNCTMGVEWISFFFLLQKLDDFDRDQRWRWRDDLVNSRLSGVILPFPKAKQWWWGCKQIDASYPFLSVFLATFFLSRPSRMAIDATLLGGSLNAFFPPGWQKPHTSLLHFLLLLPVCGCTHTLPKMAWLMLTRSLLHTDWLTDWLTEDRILSSRFPKFWFLLAKTFWLRWDLGWRVSQKLGDFSLSLSLFLCRFSKCWATRTHRSNDELYRFEIWT